MAKADDLSINAEMTNSAWYAALTKRTGDMYGALGWLDDEHLRGIISAAERLRTAALEEQNGRRADR